MLRFYIVPIHLKLSDLQHNQDCGFDLLCSTRMAFESKLAKSSKSTDFRISPTLCTMFNVMVDAKDQSAKLCAMEMGSEVKHSDLRAVSSSWNSISLTSLKNEKRKKKEKRG